MPPPPSTAGDARFHTTLWTVVREAADPSSGIARDALARLCSIYRYPLYAWLRRQGSDVHEAQDLLQGFFTELLSRHDFDGLSPDKGRFRSWLLASLKHHRSRVRERERAEKRGGGRAPIPLDVEDDERRYAIEPADGLTADLLYERRWALLVLERGIERLREEQAALGNGRLFERLQPHLLSGERAKGLDELAIELRMGGGAVKTALYRLRKRFRAIVLEEVAGTVGPGEDVEDEIATLFRALER